MKAPLSLVVVLAIMTSSLTAGADAECESWGGSRVLNGHAFLPLELVSWPFITTHAGFVVGGGMVQQNATGVDENFNPTTASISTAALAQGFNLGVGLFDWVAIRAQFAGLMLTGSSVSDLLGFGAVFQYSLGGGVLVRVVKTRVFRLGIGADFTYGQGKAITPGVALATIQQTLDVDQAKDNLLIDVSQWDVAPVLAAAVAPISFVGLQSSVSFQIGNQQVKDVSSSSKALHWGIGVELDLSKAHVPLAFPVAYRLTQSFGDSSTTDHDIEAGVFYSGRSSLDLGVSFQTKVGGDQDSKRYLGVLRLSYIW